MSTWRVCRSSTILGDECSARWPTRRKPDGTIGDAAHRARQSDHNPDRLGIVRARDIDVHGIDAPWLAQHLVDLGKTGHPAFGPDAYVIFNRLIATRNKGFTWRPYGGSDPHTGHIHVSFTSTPGANGYDSTAGFMLAGATIPPPSKDKVMPRFNPPIHMTEDIVADLPCPTGGAWSFGRNGGVFCWGGAPYLGSPEGSNRKDWGDRVAADAEPFNGGYTVIASTGERYDYPKK